MDASGQLSPTGDVELLCTLDARELARQFAEARISPVEVAHAALDRAECANELFNAFTRIDREHALASAKSSEERWRRGTPLSPIDGVPTTIKDIVWVKDWPARYGTLTADGENAPADSPAVEKLRAAGAILIGLTTTPEFGWKAVTDSLASGVTRNPWNPALTPGGSSGGAAVAAVTGAGVLHLGTDGGGSIRIPSAFCGVIGFKPTFGRVPAYPPSAFGTVAHLGPIARTVDDAFAMLCIMSGRDHRDWFQGASELPPLSCEPSEVAGLRIGYWRTPPCGYLDSEVGTILDTAVSELEASGAFVEPFELPNNDDVLWMFNTLWFASAANRASQLEPTQVAKLDPGLREAIAPVKNMLATEYVRAGMARVAFGLAMDRLLENFDVVVSPATSIPPFEAGLEVPPDTGLTRWTEWAGFSFPINLSQQPAMVMPCGRTTKGLPVGLQIVGARGADGSVFSIGKAFSARLQAIQL